MGDNMSAPKKEKLKAPTKTSDEWMRFAQGEKSVNEIFEEASEDIESFFDSINEILKSDRND